VVAQLRRSVAKVIIRPNLAVEAGETSPAGLAKQETFSFLVWAHMRGVGHLGSESMMVQVDPWEKAADCERALRLIIDPVHRENLTTIREFWISLANKRRYLSEHEFANEVETIGRLHANLTAPTPFH
jgi:hypothetical protein